jgi:hypothetical protein
MQNSFQVVDFIPSMYQVASLAYVEGITPLQALSTKIFMHSTKKEPLYITYALTKMCSLSSKGSSKIPTMSTNEEELFFI